MHKITALYCVVTGVILIAFSHSIQAQQQNRPAATGTPAPVINPVPGAYPSGADVNYVRTTDALKPITDPNVLLNAGYQDAMQSIEYVDGLGRPLQTVTRQITPQVKDMVAPVKYDVFGREVYKYLPYASTESNGQFKTDPFNAQKTFMQVQYPDEQVYYSQTNYEASPLDRVSKTMAPGNSWAGSNRGVSMDYQVNTLAEGIRIWIIANNPLSYSNNDVTTNIPSSPGAYNTGELFKDVTKDEAGNATVSYTDKEGQVLLKKVQVGNIPADYSGHDGFLCTYYVYDDMNRLRFVIPPKAVTQLALNTWQFTADIINELCFRYEYDGLLRVIAKKVPGAGWVYSIYDTKDRLVFLQDANMRKNNRWAATLYDGLNRPVITGIMTWSGTPVNLQQTVTLQTTTGVLPPGLEYDITLPGEGQPSPVSGQHQAYSSITLVDGFESGTDFTAEIITGNTTGSEESIVDGVSVNKNPLPAGAGFIALSKTYHDNYNWTNTSFTAAYNSLLDAGNNLHAENMPSQANTETMGMCTGISVRVIEDVNDLATGGWLHSVNFYDDKGRIIQTYSGNNQGGRDIITSRYNFTDKVICTYLDHTNPAGAPNSLHIKTNMEYDHAGRLIEVWKTINDNNAKKALITKNEYNELGQLIVKKLGRKKDVSGNYTSNPIETLGYTFNIRGWMTGINKDYANNTGSTGSWFGMELNYDKGFEKAQYNGNVAGTKWRSKGDGERRAYGFTYDRLNRILGGDFTQFDGSNYADNSTIKFDMVMGDGLNTTSAYDENGNIKSLKQWGLKLNNSNPIDDLQYNYFSNSNKLQSVQDLATGGTAASGTGVNMGDFADRNTSNIDYGYDENGNMVTDLNKKMNGSTGINVTTGEAIIYNFLNLPAILPVKADNGTEKGTVTYIYDATGQKLKKVVVDKSVSGKTIVTTTDYIGGLVYESRTTTPANTPNDDYTGRLLFMAHEEGRVRYIAAAGTAPARFEYDYFVKDHLGNVRMVLTEEQQQDIYPAATLEGSLTTSTDAAFVEKQYYNIDAANVVDRSLATGISDYQNNNGVPNNNPNSNTTANSQKLYKLAATGTANGGVTGLGITLKVMSGDKIDIFGKSYYFQNNTGGQNYQVPVEAIVNGLFGTPGGAAGSKGITAADVIGQSGLTSLISSYLADPGRANNGTSTTPKAYINWILLDDQFKYVSGSFDRVGASNAVKSHNLSNISVNKNGYLYVYTSNESPVNVFFDNLQVIHTRGPILEETHYYPFGLAMAGISSRIIRADYSKNRKLFNDGSELASEEFTDGSGLELYETTFRSYDPQIGRFHQIDPLGSNTNNWTPYAFTMNNPLLYNDPLGLDTLKKNEDGSLPTERPDGSELQESDVILDEAGAVSDYFNGNKWATPKSLKEVSVVATKKSESSQQTNVNQAGPAQNPAVLNSPVGNAPINSRFRVQRNVGSRTHIGTDYPVPTGTPVHATASGRVVRANRSSSYGNVVIIDHGPSSDRRGNVYTLYAHASVLRVHSGQQINTGNVVMLSGATGNVTGPHLHYEVIRTTLTPDNPGFYGNLNIRFGPDHLSTLLRSP